MGVWEGLSRTSDIHCEVPGCGDKATVSFGPAFESPGGWSGDHHEYDPKLEIAFVCEEHKPKRLKED